ncbi:MAG: STAS/SEC14 domain-containing protein [Pirellulales bacterium]|nr:STAS/SEC14 domain-containing protein [Pirellulales bacterium]
MDLRLKAGSNLFSVRLGGTVTRRDYREFLLQCERAIREHGKIRVLFEMHNFQGWGHAALWEDTKFDTRWFNQVERLAIVGERLWEESIDSFRDLFQGAEIRYFDYDAVDDATAWIENRRDVMIGTPS